MNSTETEQMISRQGPSKVRTAELEAECLRLRREGLTHRAIAARLGVAPATAYRRLRHALDEINERNLEDAGTLRGLEMLRLDELQNAIWQRAIDGDGKALDRILAIMGRRTKLLGLDAPQRQETKVKIDPQKSRFLRELLVKRVLADAMNREADGS
jgi:DNA-binding CsgD family transcriptional regulator